MIGRNLIVKSRIMKPTYLNIGREFVQKGEKNEVLVKRVLPEEVIIQEIIIDIKMIDHEGIVRKDFEEGITIMNWNIDIHILIESIESHIVGIMNAMIEINRDSEDMMDMKDVINVYVLLIFLETLE